ncbi:hypothetical protein [Halolactibacillus sp. JCM 19043]|uniref:hypothetical protein n=1 Tax=Halolactibacillus sp. JCM 19043 TaxID=1460638 RepID=UPI003513076C
MIQRYRREPMPRPLVLTFEYSLVLLGSFMIAIGFNLFLLPNQVASGALPVLVRF